MANGRKICVIIGSRANWGRLKAVVKAIDEHPDLQLQLIVGASAVDLPIPYPYEAVQCLVDGDNLQTMTLTTGLFLTQIGGVLERLKPDIMYLHGDRHELMAPAIAAAYQNLGIAHGEGGDVTGTIDEKVRHAITKLADIHFPVTELSAKRIIAMGEYPDMVHMVGSTALDSLVGIDLTNNRTEPYLVILHHPNTTRQEDVGELIKAVGYFKMPKVWVNPNVDPGSKAMLKLIHKQDVEFVKNLPPEEYVRLIANCVCLIGNTSSGIKEGAFLGTPYVCVGARQEGREHGNNVVFAECRKRDIIKQVCHQIDHGKYPRDYRFGDGTAGKKVAAILSRIEVREKKFDSSEA